MNTDLMIKLQTLIHSNQDKLEQLVEALESYCKGACNENNIIKYPWVPRHPYDDYKVSEKDIGSVVKLWDHHLHNKSPCSVLTRLNTTKACLNYGDVDAWWNKAAPYTDIIKLHFNPYYATADSEMPSELHRGMWIALLFNTGTIDITDCPDDHYWRNNEDFQYIVGYQVLQFVNPVLDK